MSMWLEVFLISKEDCEKLLWQFNSEQGKAEMAKQKPKFEQPAKGFAGLLALLFSKATPGDSGLDPTELMMKMVGKEFGKSDIDIDQFWEPLDFLTTGERAGDLKSDSFHYLESGIALEQTEAGYGPFNLLTPDIVGEYAAYLTDFAKADFERNWELIHREPEPMYGSPEENTPEEREIYETLVNQWKDFVLSAAESQQGILWGIS